MLLLRLACSGAAYAPPGASRAGGNGPALFWRLSATFVALLLLPALPRLCNSTVGNSAALLNTAHHLTMVADPDACKSLHGRGPVTTDTGSLFTSNDALFARCGGLCTAYNKTSRL